MDNSLHEIETLKQQGEIASEQGDQTKALEALDKAFILALKENRLKEAINILGHHLHVYKALHRETGNKNFMEMFYVDALAGERLAEQNGIAGQPLSVMHLRMGDYFLFREDFPSAIARYGTAVHELNAEEQQAAETNAEYLGHLALAQVKGGEKEGFENFQKALKLISSTPALREFHRLIIQSGILLRLAEAHAFAGDKAQAQKALAEAKAYADQLADQHNMSTRQSQVQELERKLGT